MNSVSRWRIVFLVAFLFGSAGRLGAQSYTSIVVFGDSLSDTGNFASTTTSSYGIAYPSASFNYASGRFTSSTATTPATKAYSGVWVEQMAKQFTAKPAVTNSLSGGTNYAYGDATTADGTSTVTIAAGLTIQVPNMGQQVTTYLASATPNASTLYVLFGGSNDLFADSSSSGVSAAAQREANLVQRLITAGGTNFLVPNLPPLGSTPYYAGTSNAATLSAAAMMFRTLLAADLLTVKTAAASGGKTVQIYQPDLYTQFTTLEATPGTYGLTNSTVSAQGLSLASADTYLFWDTIHPTTTGHHDIAAVAENLLSPLSASSTGLTVTPATAGAGTTVTLTATVTGTGATKPSGLVTFFGGTGTAMTALGSAVLDANGTGTTTFVLGSVSNPYPITAVYAGDTAYLNGTSGAVSVGTAIPTVTTLAATPIAVNAGTAVNLTATVTSSNGVPGGSVTFLDGTTSLGSVALTGAGVAALSTSSLASGSHTVTAVYAASGLYAASTSAGVTVLVTGPSVSVTFSSSTLTVQHGSSGNVIVSLTPAGGATGTVSLSCGSLPAHTSCSFSPASVTLSGTATQTSTLTIGTAAVSSLSRPSLPGHGDDTTVYAFCLLGLLGVGTVGRRRSWKGAGLLAGMVLLGGLTASLAGCSGPASATTNSTTTAPGTYNIVVTATVAGGTAVTNQGTLSVVVQ